MKKIIEEIKVLVAFIKMLFDKSKSDDGDGKVQD